MPAGEPFLDAKRLPLLPLVYDNLSVIQLQYEESLRKYHQGRTPALKLLTTLSFLGGLALLLLVAMLGILGLARGGVTWLVAIGATICSLFIGTILVNPDQLLGRGEAPGAMVSTPTNTLHLPKGPRIPLEDKSPLADVLRKMQRRGLAPGSGAEASKLLAPFRFSKDVLTDPADKSPLLIRLLKTDKKGQATITYEADDPPAIRVNANAQGALGSAVHE